jgi:hypothetical protein
MTCGTDAWTGIHRCSDVNDDVTGDRDAPMYRNGSREFSTNLIALEDLRAVEILRERWTLSVMGRHVLD